MCLLERSQRRTVRKVDAGEFESPSGIVATGGVELRTMVRKGQQVLSEKNLEARLRGPHLFFRLGGPAHGGQHLRQTPGHFRVAGQDGRDQQGLRFRAESGPQTDLRQMHARFHITGQTLDGLLIPLGRPSTLWLGDQLSP